MDEAVASDAIPDQHNEEYSESEVLPEVASGSPEDIDVDTSAHPEETKDQDAEASAHPEVPADVPEDHEVPVARFKDEGNTQKTPEYGRKMDLDVENIDKND